MSDGQFDALLADLADGITGTARIARYARNEIARLTAENAELRETLERNGAIASDLIAEQDREIAELRERIEEAVDMAESFTEYPYRETVRRTIEILRPAPPLQEQSDASD